MGWEWLNLLRESGPQRPSDGRQLPPVILAFGIILTLAWIVFLAWVTIKTFGAWRH
jgi:hypothetical protein